MRSRLALLAGVALLAGLPALPAAAAGPGQHCVVEVIERMPDGQLIVTPPQCFVTMSEALATVDGPAGGGSASVASSLATHYDGANYTGASITISGSICNGGWLNLSLDWRNRISSTANSCPTIRHYSGLNLTGAYENTSGSGGNLFTLGNKTDSIQYL